MYNLYVMHTKRAMKKKTRLRTCLQSRAEKAHGTIRELYKKRKRASRKAKGVHERARARNINLCRFANLSPETSRIAGSVTQLNAEALLSLRMKRLLASRIKCGIYKVYVWLVHTSSARKLKRLTTETRINL